MNNPEAGTGIVEVEKTETLPVTHQQGSVEALLSQAVASGASVDTMERLLAMRRELKDEAAQQAFNDAMSAFQAECPVIEKTKAVKTKAGNIAYKYAPIESTVSQVKDLITKHGFRYSTRQEYGKNELGETTVKAICRVVHKLGHVEETPMEVPLGSKTDVMSNSQVVAAASTFAKRYAFLNAFGIMTGDEDNDAKPNHDKTGPERATEAQKAEVDSLATAAGLTKAELTARFRAKYKNSITEMTSVQALGVIESLKTMVKKPATA